MRKSFLRFSFAGMFVLGGFSLQAQTLFQSFDGMQAPSKGEQIVHPVTYRIVTMNYNELLSFLSRAGNNYEQAIVVDLPTPDGKTRSFKIWKNNLLPAALQAKYPSIRTYTAEAEGDKTIMAKIDFTEKGFHAMVFDGDNTYFIDPYSNVADGYYMVYFKKDYKRSLNESMHCEVGQTMIKDAEGNVGELLDGRLPGIRAKQFGTQRRKYQLALSCTGEYAVAVAGASPTKAGVLSAMTTTMNRVNGIYEKEFGVSMDFIPNEDTLIYLDAFTDPFAGNDNGYLLLDENEATTKMLIGTANYDIGHIFSTGGGGLAGLGVVCLSDSSVDSKAYGVTGSANPVGDPYDVDYVAHEIGHQFGGEHTFNSESGACAGNIVTTASYEPGSGSTIMGYAGICDPDNIQPNSNDYFHIKSLWQISDYILTGGGGTCAVISSGTSIPTLPAITGSYSIPYKTPFELEAPLATASGSDSLLYCWEQWDLGNTGNYENVSDTFKTGPTFRSFQPTKNRMRVFPAISKVIANTPSTLGERLPTVARTMKFKVAARNMVNGTGAFNFSDNELVLNVINTGAPFVVTKPDLSSDSAKRKTNYTVKWNVAQTNVAPISASKVDIFLSVDGGYTYPFTLATGVPNTGTATVLMADTASTTARIKVKGSGNVFFDISNANFTVYGKKGVGVNDVALNNDLNVYPNPAMDIIHVSNKGTHTLTYELYNVIGQKMIGGTIQQQAAIPVAAFAKGIYYLKIMDEKTGAIVSKPVSVR